MVDEFTRACLVNYGDEHHLDLSLATELLRGNPELAEANIWAEAAAGNTAAVRQFLDQTPGLENQKGGPCNRTPLLYACYSRFSDSDSTYDAIETARLLLERGADPDAYFMTHGTYRFTCLSGAIGEGEKGLAVCPPHDQAMELATLLLDHGANPNDGQGLYNSMFTGGTHWIELLLKYGLNAEHPINWSKDDDGSTLDFLLAHACSKNMLDRMELLLRNGANPDALDWYQKVPCYEIALRNGNTQATELLVRYGAEPIEPQSVQQQFSDACMAADRPRAEAIRSEHSKSTVDSWIAEAKTNVSRAVDADRVDAVKMMLEMGFPIGMALFDAAWSGKMQMAKVLVRHGGNVRQRHPVHFATPLGFANYAGKPAVRDYLLQQDIDLFDAIRFADAERVASILAADPDALERPFQDYLAAGWEAFGSKVPTGTPLVHAVMHERTDTVGLLLKHGADQSARHQDGRTLVQVAKDNQNEAMIRLLDA